VDIRNLNERQRQAVEAVNGPVLVIAGAGTGKTRALTCRIQSLIENHNVSPYNILAITFTNKASNEMRERLANVDNGGVTISTFHAFCAKVLREFIYKMDGYTKYFTIYNEDEKNKLIKKIIADLNINIQDFHKECNFHISNAKNVGLTPIEYENEHGYVTEIDNIIKVYSAYEEQLSQNNALDFDDLLVKTHKLFIEYKDVLEYLQDRYKYIHIDEFQDTNVIQYKIITKLAKKHGNIFAVGDEDQCIYGWRGASYENTNLFVKQFSPQVIKLEQNYRSTKNVLELANKLILNNPSRIEKALWTTCEDQEQINFYKAYSDQEEAEYVARKVYDFINNKGVNPNDIAILFRMGALSRLIEERLLNYNIKYAMYGGFKFFERVEIRNILSYLWVLYNPNDNESFKRIINYPKRGIGKTSIDNIEAIANANATSMFEVVSNLDVYGVTGQLKTKMSLIANMIAEIKEFVKTNENPLEIFKFVLEIAQIREQYDKKKEEDNDRLLNIGQLEGSVSNFVYQNPELTLVDFLQSVTLSTQDDEDANVEAVRVSTVHAVKGLEFEVVFIIGSEDGLFPMSRSLHDSKELEEERRLMYVAITRSKKHLFLTCSESRYLYSARTSMLPSRFLKEMGLVKGLPGVGVVRPEGYTSYKHASFANFKNNNDNNYVGGMRKDFNSVGVGVLDDPIDGNSNVNSNTQMYNYAPNSENNTANSNLITAKKLEDQQSKASQFQVGASVLHPKFGVGEIIANNEINGDGSVVVKFAIVGVKTLNLKFAPLQIISKK